MERDILSVRQMMVLLLVALLALATDLVPSVAVRQVGHGGWLITLGVLPLLLLALWACSKLFCDRGLCVEVGKPLGYTIITIYMIWILVVLAVALRLSAVRMEQIYSKVPPIFFAVSIAVVAGWMGMGKVSALARAAEIFYLALTVMLAGILVLALFKIEWGNLNPVEWRRLPGGGLSVAGILLNVAPAAVLGTRVPKKARKARGICGWVVVFCVAVTLVLVSVVGSIGSGLSTRLDIPYLIMVQGLGVKGAFQRTEALVASMWLLSDMILVGLLLRSWHEYAAEMKNEKWGRRSVPIVAVTAVVIGWLLFPEGTSAWEFGYDVLPTMGMILGLTFPMLLLLVSGVRKRKGR